MMRFQILDQLLSQWNEKGPAGCACIVSQHGEILYEGYHGLANVEKNKPITEDTVYRVFSMTKVIVCAAAMILFERGKFLLNEPLAEYFPEYRHPMVVKTKSNGQISYEPAKNPILIKDAFCMTVGLPYTFGDSQSEREMRRVIEELKRSHGSYDLQTEVKAIAKVPLSFEPGTRWLYGYAHDLVAALIEVVSGKSLGRFLQEELFEPLGMKDTGYRFSGDIEQRMAAVYKRAEDGSLIEVPGPVDNYHQPDAKYERGGLGLYSTARDYIAFTQMLACGGEYRGERILSRKTIDLMRRNHLSSVQLDDFTNSYLAGYGYGLGVRTMMDPSAGNSNSSIGEFGWSGALGTWTSIDPNEALSIVYMHQMNPSSRDEYIHLRVRSAVNACIE